MAKGLPPSTHAASFMRLYYGNATYQHQVNLWLNDELSPTAADARAAVIADTLKGILWTGYAVTGYAYGLFGDAAPVPTPFTPVKAGTREENDGARFYGSNSWTVTFSGIGSNPAAGEAKGKARVEIVPGVTIGFNRGARFVPLGVNDQLDAFYAMLNDPTIGIMNVYGQNGAFYPQYSVQFNAMLQEKRGT